MKHYVKTNKAAWEEAFTVSEGYGDDVVERLRTETFPFFVPEFSATLSRYDFRGKTIAQFFCNNGRELLSLVHQSGAAGGVGFDIAENLVAQAAGFARATGIPCRFVAADALAPGGAWDQAFDAAFVTVGALCWIEDLGALFQAIRKTLRPGAVFLIHEYHPFTNMLAVATEPEYDPAVPAKLVWPYFRTMPFLDAMGMHYMAGRNYPSKTFTSFAHPFAELFAALIAAGFTVAGFSEHDRDTSGNFEALEGKGLPLSFIVAATAR